MADLRQTYQPGQAIENISKQRRPQRNLAQTERPEYSQTGPVSFTRGLSIKDLKKSRKVELEEKVESYLRNTKVYTGNVDHSGLSRTTAPHSGSPERFSNFSLRQTMPTGLNSGLGQTLPTSSYQENGFAQTPTRNLERLVGNHLDHITSDPQNITSIVGQNSGVIKPTRDNAQQTSDREGSSENDERSHHKRHRSPSPTQKKQFRKKKQKYKKKKSHFENDQESSSQYDHSDQYNVFKSGVSTINN